MIEDLVSRDELGNIIANNVNLSPILERLKKVGIFAYYSEDDKELCNLIFYLERAAALSEVFVSSLTNEFLNMEGMSTEKTRHYLNNVCSTIKFSSDTKNYFEVGCAGGSTYISSNFKTNLDSSYVCDIFTDKKCGSTGAADFINNCQEYLGAPPENLLNQDCFSLDLDNFTEKINLYLFDGPHDVGDHEKAFTYFEEIFDDTVVVFIDDWNDDRVQLGTLLGLSKIDYDVVFWRYDPANQQIAPFGVTPLFRAGIRLDNLSHKPRGYSLKFGDVHRWGNGFMTLILRKRVQK